MTPINPAQPGMKLEPIAQDAEISHWLQQIIARFMRDGALPAVLDEIMAAAIAITHADMGNIQLYNPSTGRLKIAVQRGLDKSWVDFIDSAEASQTACSIALQQDVRVIIDDVAHSPLFIGTPALAAHLACHARAVQSTPLHNRDGQLIGALSTYSRRPWQPAMQDLHQIDHFLSQTIAIIASAQAAMVQQERETHYHLLFDGMQEAVAYSQVFYDAQGRATDWLYLDANPALERLLGTPNLAGKRASEIFPGRISPPELLEVYGRVALSGQAEDFEGYIGALNKWIRISAFSPKPDHVIAIGEDISLRKRIEAALNQTTLLSEALNRINVALHSTLDFHEITQRLLSEGTRALGSETAAILLRNEHDWLISDVYRLPAITIGTAVSDQEAQHAVLAIQSRQIIMVDDALQDPRINRDYLRQYNIRAALVAPLIARNKTLGVMCFNYHSGSHAFSEAEVYFAQQLATTAAIALDNARLFNERLQAGVELSTSEQRLNLALSAAEMGLWDWNMLTDTVLWNEKHFSLFGIDPATFNNQAAEAFAPIHPEDRGQVQQGVDHALTHQEAFYIEFRVVHPDESVHWIASRGQQVKGSPSDHLRMIGICFDITERKQADQERERYLHQENTAQMQRMHIAGEFAALLAHQLNQPLSAVRSFAEAGLARLRRGTDAPGRMQETLADIVAQSERAAQEIRDLRNFLARQPQEMAASDLNTLVRAANSLMSTLMRNRKIRVTLDLPNSLPMVLMRASQIEQVFINLMENAADVVSQNILGNGAIHISTQLDVVHNVLITTVRDNGSGLDAAAAKRVFDPLYTTKNNGIGMGLAISRSIVEDHGGRIWAEPGMSGCFKFTLPVATI